MLKLFNFVGLFTFSLSLNVLAASNYQSLSAKEKQEILWSQISENPYVFKPQLGAELFLQALGTPALLDLRTTIDRSSDVLPFGRIKFIHPIGSCAKIRWVSRSNEYSGLFETGTVGIIRMGWAVAPELMGYIPGASIKLLAKGEPSKNILAIYSLDGQGDDSNYFSNPLSNKIPEPKNLLIQSLLFVFKLASRDPLYLPLDHVASVKRNGRVVDEIHEPAQIFLTSPLKSSFAQNGSKDLRLQFAELKSGTLLFNVSAKSFSGDRSKVGQIFLESEFVDSAFCDQKLFFQHNSVESKEMANESF
jgi:hypothetical protein